MIHFLILVIWHIYGKLDNMSNLFTVGYQGNKVSDLIQKLKKLKIKAVVDVRENPVSRKPGFSKLQLNNELEKEGIHYLHYQELGTPRPLRDYLINNQNYDSFFSKYKNYLSEYEDSLDDLVELGTKEKICLLCFEKDVMHCHRKVITDYLTEKHQKNITITHL